MKSPISLLAGLALCCLGLVAAGCGGGGKPKMDTADVEKAFASADASLKGPAEEAVKMLKAGKLLDGSTALANLAKSAEKLSEEQKNAMVNLGATIQLIMSADGDQADLKVYQAVDDMLSALEGRESTPVGVTPDQTAPIRAPGK